MEILFAFLGGLVLASAVAFFVARSVVKSRVSQAENNVRLQAEGGFNAERARLESELTHAKEMSSALENQLEEEKKKTQAEVQRAKDEAEEKNAAVMKELGTRFDETIGKVKAEMEVATAKMLKDRQQEFSEKNNKDIEQILTPLKEKIAELKDEMKTGHDDQVDLKAQMEQQVKNMLKYSESAKKSADELASALMFGSKVQGDWGETILEQLLDSQGLTKGIEYDSQYVVYDAKGHPVKGEEGSTMRLDIILHLGDNREVIIDSKVSLKDYVAYVNAETEEDKKKYLKAHIDSLKKHVLELSRKDYSSYIQPPKVSAGFVMMFIPNAGALWTALRADSGLWRWAADKNVYIADEQSLYGALKIVDATWKRVKQAQNHKEVFALADEMIKRVSAFMVQYKNMGEALDKAKSCYEDGEKKLQPQGQSIIKTANELIRLGAKSDQPIAVSSTKKLPAKDVLAFFAPPEQEESSDSGDDTVDDQGQGGDA